MASSSANQYESRSDRGIKADAGLAARSQEALKSTVSGKDLDIKKAGQESDGAYAGEGVPAASGPVPKKRTPAPVPDPEIKSAEKKPAEDDKSSQAPSSDVYKETPKSAEEAVRGLLRPEVEEETPVAQAASPAPQRPAETPRETNELEELALPTEGPEPAPAGPRPRKRTRDNVDEPVGVPGPAGPAPRRRGEDGTPSPVDYAAAAGVAVPADAAPAAAGPASRRRGADGLPVPADAEEGSETQRSYQRDPNKYRANGTYRFIPISATDAGNTPGYWERVQEFDADPEKAIADKKTRHLEEVYREQSRECYRYLRTKEGLSDEEIRDLWVPDQNARIEAIPDDADRGETGYPDVLTKQVEGVVRLANKAIKSAEGADGSRPEMDAEENAPRAARPKREAPRALMLDNGLIWDPVSGGVFNQDEWDEMDAFHEQPAVKQSVYANTIFQDSNTYDDYEQARTNMGYEPGSGLTREEFEEEKAAEAAIWDAYAKAGIGSGISLQKKNEEQEQAAVAANRKLSSARFRVEGEYFNEAEGHHDWKDRDVKEAFESMGKIFGLDPYNARDFTALSDLMRRVAGVGVDSSENIFVKQEDATSGVRGTWRDTQFTGDKVIHIAEMLSTSMDLYGHPFGITKAHLAGGSWGTANRFPCGAVPIELCQKLVSNENSVLAGWTASELQDKAKADWNEYTKPMMMSAGKAGRATTQQIRSIEYMVLAVCEAEGIDPKKNYGVDRERARRDSNFIENHQAFQAWMGEYARPDEDEKADKDGKNKKPDMAHDAAFFAEERMKAVYDAHEEMSEGKQFFTWFWKTGRSIVSGLKIVGAPQLILSGFGEAGLNSIAVKATNAVRLGPPNSDRAKKAQLSPEFKKAIKSKASVRSFSNIQKLIDRGGMDALVGFCAQGVPMTEGNVQTYLNKTQWKYHVKKKTDADGNPLTKQGATGLLDKFVETGNDAASLAGDVTSVLFPGDAPFHANQALRFMETLAADQALRADGVSAADLYRMFEADPEMFWTRIMSTNAGKQALTGSKNFYTGRLSPLSEFVRSACGDKATIDFAFASALETWYGQFAVKAFERMVPFSNTIEYAVANGMMEKVKADNAGPMTDDKMRAITNMERFASLSIGYGEVGGFKAGLKKAFLWDAMACGTGAARTLFFYGLLKFMCDPQMPDDDPENPLKKFFPWEWTIRLPWETEEQRRPLRQAWFMDDMFLGEYAAAMAIFAWRDTGDPTYLCEMVYCGYMDILSQNQVFGLASTIFDMLSFSKDLAQSLDELDPDTAAVIRDEIGDNTRGPNAAYLLASGTAKFLHSMQPMMVTDWYKLMGTKDDFEKNPYIRKLPEPTIQPDGTIIYPKKSDYTMNSMQAAWQVYALNDPMLAWIGNKYMGMVAGDDHFYGRENAEDKTYRDPELDKKIEEEGLSYEGYLKDQHLKDSDEAKGTYASHIIKTFQDDYDSDPKKALAAGYMIPYESWKIVGDTLYYQSDELQREMTRNAKAIEDGSVSSWDGQKINKKLWNQYYEIQDLIKSYRYGGIVYLPQVYKQVEGYRVHEMTSPFTGLSSSSYSYGSNLADEWMKPFTSPNRKTPGDAYLKNHIGTEVGNDFKTNSVTAVGEDSSKDMATAPDRNLVINTDNDMVKRLWATDDAKIESLKNSAAQITEDWKQITGGGGSYGGSYGGSRSYRRRSGGGGGGGGGYAPNIYSSGGKGYSSTPHGMYTKTPYSTQRKYLSPTVYSTGSRDAYSRRES